MPLPRQIITELKNAQGPAQPGGPFVSWGIYTAASAPSAMRVEETSSDCYVLELKEQSVLRKINPLGELRINIDDTLPDIECSVEFKEQSVLRKVNPLGQLRIDIADTLPDIECSVEPFLEGSTSLQLFYVLKLPRIRLSNLACGPFEIAHRLQTELDLASCDPVFEQDERVDEQEEERKRRFSRRTFLRPLTSIFPISSGGGDDDFPADYEWHLENAGVKKGWDFSVAEGKPVAGNGIVIAQVDTGLAHHNLLDHPSLEHPKGENFVSPPPYKPIDPMDYRGNPGHGLAVAAVAASRGDTGKGGQSVRGSAYNATIMPMRAITSVANFWSCHWTNIVKAIDAAVQKKAHVITMSLGGEFAPKIMRQAIANAVAKNTIIICAAGQASRFVPLRVTYPARDPNTIAVGGSTSSSKYWSDSFRGKEVTISAPSVGIVRAMRDKPSVPVDNLNVGNGTSFGTALCGGIAAMWLAHHGRDTLIRHFGSGNLQAAFEACCKKACRTSPSWNTDKHGAGIIDAGAMLRLPLDEIASSLDTVSMSTVYQLSREELLDNGAKQALVKSLSDEALDIVGNELLWLRDTTKKSSPFLEEKLR